MKKSVMNSPGQRCFANLSSLCQPCILLIFLVLSADAVAKTPQKVTYLYNSGWLIETENELILIDYVPSDKLNLDSVLFKKLQQGEALNKRAYILITHEHSDHFYQPLLRWHLTIKGLNTILGWNYSTTDKSILKVYNRDSLTTGSLKIIAHPSTDAGSGFLIIAGELTFYHAGDHAAWSEDLIKDYGNELSFVKHITRKIDMVFIPIVRGKLGGCKNTESITEGAMLALQIMKPDIVFPMHIQCDDLNLYKEFNRQVAKRFPSIVTKVPLFINYEFTF